MKITDDIASRIRSMADQGMYKAQIAKSLGLSEGAVHYFCKKNSIELKKGINKISGEIEERIRKLAVSGHHLSEIERLTGIDYNTILYWSKKNNIPVVNGRTKLKVSEEQAIEIRRMAAAGEPKTAIASKLGLTKPAIAEFCKRNDVVLQKGNLSHPGPKSKSVDLYDKIAMLIEQGKHASAIAKDLGVSIGIVTKAAEHRKLKLSRGYSGKFTDEDLTSMLNPAMEMTGLKISGKYEVRCKKHNFVKMRPATSLSQGCPVCSNNGNSRDQQDVKTFLENIGMVVTEKHRVGRRELDLVVADKKLAIEYCGLYWHTEDSPHPRLRSDHISKMRLSNEHGYRLITIFEDEWRDRRSQVEGFLRSVLGVSTRRLFARKCEVRQIASVEARDFCDAYHIQGAGRSSSSSFGLFADDEMLGVITSSPHHRGSAGKVLVLDRLCFVDGVQVAGGSSKLLKALVGWAKVNGYEKIVSWSDNRWSEGNVYLKLGFTMDEELGPDYSYVKNRNRYSKQSNRKKDLLRRGAVGDTELEMAKSLGMSRIWDCGKKRWVLDIR